MSEKESIVHILISGSQDAGISSFIRKKAEDFEPLDEAGLGIDIQTTNITMEDGKECKMHFYEIAGTFPLESLGKILRKKHVGLAIVFDISNTVSLELGEVLFNRIQEKLGAKSMPKHKFLLGSHLDLEKSITQPRIDAVLTLMGEDTHYLEFSSKTGENVDESLRIIAKKILG
ncbi:MAG: hypothetical protein ACTSUE_05330 [Promethearchaeota archaeon]